MIDHLRTLPRPSSFQQGQIAFHDGQGLEANPYASGWLVVADYPGDYANWHAGWVLAQGWAKHAKA